MKRIIMSGVVALAMTITSQRFVVAHQAHHEAPCVTLKEEKHVDALFQSAYDKCRILMLENVAQGKMSVDEMERALAAFDRSLLNVASAMKSDKDAGKKIVVSNWYVHDLWIRICTDMRKSSLDGVGKVISSVSYMTANIIAMAIFGALLWAIQEHTHAFTLLADNVIIPSLVGAGKALGKGLLESGFKLLPEVPMKETFIGLYKNFPLSSANVKMVTDLGCGYLYSCP